MSTQRLFELLKAFVHQLSSCHIPRSIEETLLDPRWVQAIKEELEALRKNNTWMLIALPEGKNAIE